MEFEYDGGGLAKGGAVTLYVDGKTVGEGRVEQTVPMVFSADETCDVGKEGGLAGLAGLRADGQRVQRRGELGADRPREGRSRSPDLAGRALPRRDGAAVGVRGAAGARGGAGRLPRHRQDAWLAICRPRSPGPRWIGQGLIDQRRNQLTEVGAVRDLLDHEHQHEPGVGIDEVVRPVRPAPAVGADRARCRARR